MSILVVLVGFSYTSATAQPYGLNSRGNVAPFLNGILPPVSPIITGNWSAVPAFPNLIFTNALGLTFIPGTNQLCVWEREGRIWSFVNSSNTTQKKLVLDVSNQCQGWDDSGLLGVAFHPGFATNRFMFIYYVWVTPGTVVGDANTRPPTFNAGAYHDRLVRYTLNTNGVALTNSEVIFVDQIGDSAWHNGGGMFFHPTNGFLYWTDGDDATGSKSQVITNNLFSGVFRIDVDKRGGSISHPVIRQPQFGSTANYYIPNDNPFVGQTNAMEEFFCLGLRSPHRMTIDPPTGRIFIGDVGESQREEVDIIEPGESALNFQWNRIEGLGGDLAAPFVGINRRPVLDYTHSEGIAVIGGYVYRGSEFASDLAGKYIFGDNGARVVWVMDESTVPASKVPLCTVPQGTGPNSGNDYTGLSSFGVDAAGEFYMCQMTSLGGYIYKLSRTGPTNTLNPPPLFSQLGAFTNLVALAPASYLVPYGMNSPLWSDAAHKDRWMVLPTNTFINFSPTSNWTFPAGTVFFKNFELVTNENFPTRYRRLETRLLVCDTNGTVYGGTYKWRPDNSDADLLTLSSNENIVITTATGTRTQTWSYPGRQECLRCHTPASGGVLGPSTHQMNGNLLYPSGVTDNQLRTLNHLGVFTAPLNEAAITNYPKAYALNDTNASLELRARSYFSANCAHCHRPGGVNALFDMRFDTPLASQRLINGTALNTLGLANAKIIKPGDLTNSVLFQRDNSLGLIQMPPLAKNLVDTNAMAVIAAWINSLPIATNTAFYAIATAVPGAADTTQQPVTFSAQAFAGRLDTTFDLTDDQTGIVTAQGQNPTNEMATNVFDNDLMTKWLDFATNNPATRASWIQYRQPVGAIANVIQYTIASANDAPERDPSDWRLLGSNNGGTNWDILDLRTNQAFASRNNKRVYSIPNLNAYNLYRLQIDRVFDTNTANSVQLSELEFIGTPVATYAWNFGDGTTSALQNPLHTYTNSGNFIVKLVASDGVAFSTNTFTVATALASVLNTNSFYVTSTATSAVASVTQQLVQFSAQAYGGIASTKADTTDISSAEISAQGQNSDSGEYALNAFDNNIATKWLDFATNNPSTRASWIQYRYASNASFAVSRYTVTSANDAPERDPRDWRLLGSNTGGTNWATLDTRTGETFISRAQTRSFSFTNNTAYNLYRFQIDSVNAPFSANSVQLAELELFGSAATYAWIFGDGALSSAQNPTHAYTTNGTYTARVVASDGVSFATNNLSVTSALAALPAQWLPATAAVTNRVFSVKIQGIDGVNYVIEATTNFSNWTPVQTNSPVGGLLQFTDPKMTNLPYRFYRVRTP